MAKDKTNDMTVGNPVSLIIRMRWLPSEVPVR